jgi:ABC-type multidrug transport system ATPase subunit
MLGRFPALAGADLEVETAEVVLLSGPNGAGKTTLLRLCAGLLPLRTGEAEVLGVNLATEPRRVRRAVALVGHETFCYDDLTVTENVRFVARSTGHAAADADAAIERLETARAT